MNRNFLLRSGTKILCPSDADWRSDAISALEADSLSLPALSLGLSPSKTARSAADVPLGPASPVKTELSKKPGTQKSLGATSTTESASVSEVDGNSALAMRVDVALSTYNVTGAGIRIGILSDSFNRLGGASADITRGDLPSTVNVLKEGSSGADEGRAMAQMIHRVAPDAEIDFYSGTSSEADLAYGILALKAAGCDVIVDDVLWMHEPFWQDGSVVQTAVKQVVAGGVDYFTAAGNAGSNFYEATFTPIRVALPGISGTYSTENFGTAAAPRSTESLTVATGSTVTISLQWDQPYATIGKGHSSANSLGMLLYDSNGRIVSYALASDVGQDPSQVLQFTNTTASTGFSLAIFSNGGKTLPGQFKFITYGSGVTINDNAAGQGSGSSSGHELVAAANTVGAIAATNTTQMGGSNTVETFTALSSGTLLFDATGKRYSEAPPGGGIDFVAPDGSSTSLTASFSGTSAAAPNAAAVAALMLQANPLLTPTQISTILRSTTTSVTGPALATGSGLVQADAAVALARQTTSVTTGIAGISSAGMAAASNAASVAAITAALDGLTADPTVGDFNVSLTLDADVAAGIIDYTTLAGSFVLTSGSATPIFIASDTPIFISPDPREGST